MNGGSDENTVIGTGDMLRKIGELVMTIEALQDKLRRIIKENEELKKGRNQ